MTVTDRAGTAATRRDRSWIGALGAIVAAWAGMTIHDLRETPALVPFDPAFAIPSAIYLVLGVAWLLRPHGLAGSLIVAWALLNLVGGGILSVLPLPFLPFTPEQSVPHYAIHAVYTLSQLPLIVLALRYPAGSRTRRAPS